MVGLGSLLCSRSLQGRVGRMCPGLAFRKGIYSPSSSSSVPHEEVFLPHPARARAIRRDLLLGGLRWKHNTIPPLLPRSLSTHT